MAEAKKTTKKAAATKAKAVAAPEAVEAEGAIIAVESETSEAAAPELAETEDAETTEAKAVAKAGKRSAKAIQEAEAEAAKEERKAARAESAAAAGETEGPKVRPKTRSRLERAGKNYRKLAEQLEKDKQYTLKEALSLAVNTNPAKFDATVEMHIRLGVDPRQADQNLRDNFVLPAGSGKTVRVAVLAEADDVATAKKAGADIAGSEEFLQQLDKQKIDFDILVATPAMMPKLGKYARLLGPKGLMPNPKSGTVTTDVAKAVEQAKAGRVEYRVDTSGIVHLGIGKVSFGADKLMQNAQAVMTSIKSNKPASVKGSYIKTIHVTTTMGPGIAVNISDASA